MSSWLHDPLDGELLERNADGPPEDEGLASDEHHSELYALIDDALAQAPDFEEAA